MPKISIITTTYKHQKFIAHTIDSILAQTYTDWELLIGDDSPDNQTWEIIESYTQKYPNKIKAWHHAPNKWIVDNMNFLIGQSSLNSTYITFLEGDDLYTPNNLQEKIDVFNKHTDIACVYSGYQKIDDKSRFTPYTFFGKLWTRIKELLSSKQYGESILTQEKLLKIWNPIQSFWAIIIKKDILYLAYPFKNPDPNNKNFWILDYYIWLNLLPNKKIYKIKEKIFLYRYHNDNLSSNIETMLSQANYIYEELKLKYADNKKTQLLCDFKISLNRWIIFLLQWQRMKAIQNTLESFKYNKFNTILKRATILFLSFCPRKFNNLIFKLYRQL